MILSIIFTGEPREATFACNSCFLSKGNTTLDPVTFDQGISLILNSFMRACAMNELLRDGSLKTA